MTDLRPEFTPVIQKAREEVAEAAAELARRALDQDEAAQSASNYPSADDWKAHLARRFTFLKERAEIVKVMAEAVGQVAFGPQGGDTMYRREEHTHQHFDNDRGRAGFG